MNAYEFNRGVSNAIKAGKENFQKENLRIIKEIIDPAEKIRNEAKSTTTATTKKKKSTTVKGASAPEEPKARTTIKDAVLNILRAKRQAPTCKEMVSALRKKGFHTSHAYVRNIVRDFGLQLYPQQTYIWMKPP